MQGKALRVLATSCLALAGADRTALVAHVARGWEPSDPADGSLDYGGLGAWHAKALGEVDDFGSELDSKLEPAAAGAVGASERYAEMVRGLGGGLEGFKDSLGAFRSANSRAQGRSNEEVRQVLQSARHEADEDEPGPVGVQPAREEDAAPESAPPAPSTTDSLAELAHAVQAKAGAEHAHSKPVRAKPAHPKPAPAHAKRPADPLASAEVEDASREAEKLTGHVASDAVDSRHALEGGSVVTKEASEEAKGALGSVEAGLGEGNASAGSGGDAGAVEQAVQKLVWQEEEQQTRLTMACFALADSPLKGADRKCNSEAVSGMFKEPFCFGHEGDAVAACANAPKCETKHVCLQDGAVVADSDGSWKVNSDASCAKGEASAVCVPRAGSFKLPPP